MSTRPVIEVDVENWQVAYDVQRQRAMKAEKALKELVDRLDFVHASDAYLGVWTLAQIHGVDYRGPTYTEELERARFLLGAPKP